MKYEIEIAPNGGVVVRDDSYNLVGAFGYIEDMAVWLVDQAESDATVAADEGWIEHDGSGRPIDPEVMVYARTRSGAILPLKNAGHWRWNNAASPSDIIAYRVVSS